MAEEEGVFFVGVKDPDGLRRDILQTAREAIETLQLFDRFSSVRNEKINYIVELKSDLREITRLLSKIKAVLPKAKLRIKLHEHEKFAGKFEEVQAKKKGKKKGAKKEAPVIKEKPMSSELEKLESELSAIEGKLGKLE
ncbi:hypothetical protein KY360_02345 [Candidatus Woesearchaeota archaeon]|nr:hypothetical protein [Candidatus Woesearchaeota archaeon]